MSLTPVEIGWAVIIVTAGALMQGTIGFGVALVAVPFLMMVDPVFVPGPMLLAAFFLGMLQFYRERHCVDRTELGVALVGRIVGSAPAIAMMKALSSSAISAVCGGLVMVGVVMSVIGMKIRPNRNSLLIGGALSGFMGTVSSVGGPAMALVYQHEAGPRMRGTLGLFFAAGSLISMVMLSFIGRFGLTEVIAGVAILPGIFLGFALSNRLAKMVDRKTLRPAVLIACAAAAVVVMVQSVL